MYWRQYPDGHPLLPEEERAYLKARTGSENEGSQGVLTKCGFRLFAEEEVEDEREKGGKVVLLEFRLPRPGVEG